MLRGLTEEVESVQKQMDKVSREMETLRTFLSILS